MAKEKSVEIKREDKGKISIQFPKGTSARIRKNVSLEKLLAVIAVEVEGQSADDVGDIFDERG
jgi:hypothetical protein